MTPVQPLAYRRAAIYARVSTNDGRQTVDNQLADLRRFASDSNWEIVREYLDHDSGTKKNRKGMTEMLDDAAKRRFASRGTRGIQTAPSDN